jgi:hypothetical protein
MYKKILWVDSRTPHQVDVKMLEILHTMTGYNIHQYKTNSVATSPTFSSSVKIQQ